MGNGKWVIEDTVVYRTEVDQVVKNFLYYNDHFKGVREDKTACDICSTNFEEDQALHLAFAREDNKLICGECFEEAKASGVYIVERGEWITSDD